MVLVTAHRGFSSKYPENTLLSIRKAIDLGAEWVEVDVWLSLDHHVIVFHDKSLDRTTNGKGRIAWKTLKEIKKCRTKKRNQQIPVLEEVLELIKKSKTKLNVEIKTIWAAKPVADLIKKCKMEQKVMVSSGKINALRIVKHEIPSLKTAYVFFISNNPRWNYFVSSLAKLSFTLTRFVVILVAKSAEVDNVHLSYPFATKAFIKRLHRNGYKVHVWVVNTKALMKKLIKRKVDGIITNHPDKLKKLLRKVNTKKKKSRRISLKRLNFIGHRRKKKKK
ncbi:hypothetical protein AYK26_04820 [Euryarchaeota archaeon SM23-78]|nr:MAG: hypothetical protein AYK26_04820 [Euryarchaeota archaeon SM23-78]MBW3000762.1 glycerophosphodiester phosphodiesterase [Candidatus Woesearchaeota archaeon]